MESRAPSAARSSPPTRHARSRCIRASANRKGRKRNARPPSSSRYRPASPPVTSSTRARSGRLGAAPRLAFALERDDLGGRAGAAPQRRLQIGRPAVLLEEIAKGFVGELLEIAQAVARQEVERLPGLVVDLNPLARHCALPARPSYRVACAADGVRRQTVLATSSATRSAPARSTATPTGRPRASPFWFRKPVRMSTGGPLGRPSLNGTNTTL